MNMAVLTSEMSIKKLVFYVLIRNGNTVLLKYSRRQIKILCAKTRFSAFMLTMVEHFIQARSLRIPVSLEETSMCPSDEELTKLVGDIGTKSGYFFQTFVVVDSVRKTIFTFCITLLIIDYNLEW